MKNGIIIQSLIKRLSNFQAIENNYEATSLLSFFFLSWMKKGANIYKFIDCKSKFDLSWTQSCFPNTHRQGDVIEYQNSSTDSNDSFTFCVSCDELPKGNVEKKLSYCSTFKLWLSWGKKLWFLARPPQCHEKRNFGKYKKMKEIDFNVDASTEFATRWFWSLFLVRVLQRKRILKCVNGLPKNFLQSIPRRVFTRYAIFDLMKSISSME